MTILRTAKLAIGLAIVAASGPGAWASAPVEDMAAAASAARLDGQGRVVLSFEAAPARPRHRTEPAPRPMLASAPRPAAPAPNVARRVVRRMVHKGAAEAWTPAMAIAASPD